MILMLMIISLLGDDTDFVLDERSFMRIDQVQYICGFEHYKLNEPLRWVYNRLCDGMKIIDLIYWIHFDERNHHE